MARFRFRFAKLLEIREYHKRAAEETFATALRQWQDAEHRAEQSANLAELALARMRQVGTYSVWQVGEGLRHAAMLRERSEQDKHHARALKGQADEARRRLVEATREHQVLEKLRARHLEMHLAEEAAEQQKLLDELSNTAYLRGQRDPTRDEMGG